MRKPLLVLSLLALSSVLAAEEKVVVQYDCIPNYANWGGVVMAVGKAGEPADRDKLSIWFNGIRVAHKGARDPGYDEAKGIALPALAADNELIRMLTAG